MNPAVFSTFLLTILVSSGVKHSHGEGLSKRFLFTDYLVDKIIPTHLKREECVLCKCYQECHGATYLVDEGALCKDYMDSIKCSEIDRCTCCNDLLIYNPCQSGGKCGNTGHGNFTCDCLSGFYGQKCELVGTPQQQTDNCASAPCLNGGRCSNGQNVYQCQCANGWTGQKCDIDINECATNNPCRNEGICSNLPGAYSCACKTGWGGTNCTQDINECATNNPCRNEGICSNLPGAYSCACKTGWGGTNCTQDSLRDCNHACSLETVVKSQSVENENAAMCPGTSSRASNEALPMQCCNIGPSSTWQKGLQVLQHCNGNKIPPYTPISEVMNGKLVPGRAGVFTTCLPDGSGFKMILQDCVAAPRLIQVDSANGGNPGNYFVIY